MVAVVRGWWRGVVLAGAVMLACSKPGTATEGPAEEAGAGGNEAVGRETVGSAPDEPGAVREGCPEGMVRIEGNETLQAFCMGETEVSVREFRRCVEAKACREFDPKWDFNDPKKATWLLGDESMPINFVDEEQARQYCAFVGGRLPTAEEWIWALGSAKGWAFPWGNEFSHEEDWYCGCWQRPGQRRDQPVLCSARQYLHDRTLQGVFDMAGSAKEIVGPNDNGDYGILLGVAPLGIPAAELSDIKWTTTNKPEPWYAGPLVIWSDTTSFRCTKAPFEQ